MTARLSRELDEVFWYWESCSDRFNSSRTDDVHEMSLIYAGLLLSIPEGLDRLSKAVILDEWNKQDEILARMLETSS